MLWRNYFAEKPESSRHRQDLDLGSVFELLLLLLLLVLLPARLGKVDIAVRHA